MKSVKSILQKENPILRKEAQEVPLEDISSTGMQKMLSKMETTLNKKPHGVALAAPQIGVSLRVFVVSEKVFDQEKVSKESLVYINPKILKISKKTGLIEEGCLSVEGKHGTVKRAVKVTIEAHDKNGKKFIRGATGLLSQIFQHEIDHLNGILYIDKAVELYDTKEDKKEHKR